MTVINLHFACIKPNYAPTLIPLPAPSAGLHPHCFRLPTKNTKTVSEELNPIL